MFCPVLQLNEDTDSDDVDTDNPFVLEECMKMFNEFQPGENHLENQVLPKKVRCVPAPGPCCECCSPGRAVLVPASMLTLLHCWLL